MEIERSVASPEIFKSIENAEADQNQVIPPSRGGIDDSKDTIESAAPQNTFRIDLGKIDQKYIGETEKNLEQTFENAEASGVSLFLDEADSLFGKSETEASSENKMTSGDELKS